MSQPDPQEGATQFSVPAVSPSASTARKVFGVILLIVGVGMTLVSGLCTAAFTVGDMFSSSGGGGGDINLTGIQFFVGGPFIVVGALLWWGGHRLLRPWRKRRAAERGGATSAGQEPPAEEG